jgi:cardiolipin synthase
MHGQSRMKPRWLDGNDLILHVNGESYYPRVFAAIAAAHREVFIETFILFDDAVGRRLRAALLLAARAGAAVHLLVDGWGSPDLGPDFMRPLLDAGVHVRAFEPGRRLFGRRLHVFRRMHRKLVVVDGNTAFCGGINFAEDYLAETHPEGKQDYALEIRGPLVAQMREFCHATVAPAASRRESRSGDSGRRTEAAAGRNGARAAFVTRDNQQHRDDIERQYRLALRAARTRVIIANAYFFPGWRLLRALRRAARRGVQVDLLLQGQPDKAWVRAASRLLYEHLLRAGVRIHEYMQRPLHGKVAVVDDRWATVGSSNLDPLSLGLNLEANVLVRDAAFASHLREHLDGLLHSHARLVLLEQPGRLRSAWIALRSAVIFHALRKFPVWVSRPGPRPPQVTTLDVDRSCA